MNEEWASIEKLLAVEFLPAVSLRLGRVALGRDWMRRRSEREHIKDQRLVVAFPAVRQKSAFWLPPHRNGFSCVKRPLPIGPGVEFFSERTYFALFGRSSIKVRSGGQNASKQKCRINR